jgi:L-fuculose-phosphate aldolase
MKRSLSSSKADIIEVGRRMYARSYVASNDGNISIRLDKKRILITASGVSKGFLRPSDLIVVDLHGNVVRGAKKASSETQMHLEIYKARPDVHGICHAHPPHATGFAVAGIALNQNVLPEVVITLGSIPLVPYGTPGTEELYRPLLPIVRDYDAFLLANHGVLTAGKDLFNAYFKMETVEHYAHIVCMAKLLGNVNELAVDQVEKLIAQREKFGVRKNIGGTAPRT